MQSYPISDAEKAEKLSRKRAVMFAIMPVFLLIQQFSYVAGESYRFIDGFRIGVWVTLASAMALALITGGYWFRKRSIRTLMEDKSTIAHRASALSWAFSVSVTTGIALFILADVMPMSERAAINLVVTLGIVAGMFRFAQLERRALG